MFNRHPRRISNSSPTPRFVCTVMTRQQGLPESMVHPFIGSHHLPLSCQGVAPWEEHKLDHLLGPAGTHSGVAEAQYHSAVLRSNPDSRFHSRFDSVEACREAQERRWSCCRSTVPHPYMSRDRGQAGFLRATRCHDTGPGHFGDGDER